MCLWFPYLSVLHARPVLTVGQLIRCFTSRYEQQQVRGVGYFQIIGFVSAAKYCTLIFIPPDYKAGEEETQETFKPAIMDWLKKILSTTLESLFFLI